MYTYICSQYYLTIVIFIIDKFRAKNKFMEKFPNDIKKAEELTGGNPAIAEDSKYAPSPKLSYNDLYGSPVQKKKKTTKGDY